MKTERHVIHVSIFITGIAPRCRKVDRHSIEVGDYAPESIPDDSELARLAAEKIAKYKSVCSCVVGIHPHTLETETDDESGVTWTMRKFLLCDAARRSFRLI